MLQQITDYIHNKFIRSAHPGTYTIAGGTLSLQFLKEGQRFWIVGSDLNDGIYTWHESGIKNDDDTAAVGLQAETFNGTICALAVPPAVIALAGEIQAWVEANGGTVNSPYTSESVIGVYSYTKSSGGTGAGGSISWQDVYKTRLDPYRKVTGP